MPLVALVRIPFVRTKRGILRFGLESLFQDAYYYKKETKRTKRGRIEMLTGRMRLFDIPSFLFAVKICPAS